MPLVLRFTLLAIAVLLLALLSLAIGPRSDVGFANIMQLLLVDDGSLARSTVIDLRLPRTSRELFAYQGPKIEPTRLATGDLVFFGSGGSVTHVGIYVGEGRFVHAPSTGGTVRLDHLDGSYWVRNYSGSKRVLH